MSQPRRAAVVRAVRLLVIFAAVYALSEVITDGFELGALFEDLGRGILYGLFAAVIFFLFVRPAWGARTRIRVRATA